MKSVFKVYHRKYMIRPTIYRVFYRSVIVLVIGLLWSKYIDRGMQGIGFGLSVLGLILLIFGWFNYLGLDGVPGVKLPFFKKKGQQRKQRVHDMIDFVDEDVEAFHELDEVEEACCRFVSNVTAGVLFLIVGSLLSLMV